MITRLIQYCLAIGTLLIGSCKAPSQDEIDLTIKAVPELGISLAIPVNATSHTDFAGKFCVDVNPGQSEKREFCLDKHVPWDGFWTGNYPMHRQLNDNTAITYAIWIEEHAQIRDYKLEGYVIMGVDTIYVSSHWEEDVLFFTGSKQRRNEFSFIYLKKMTIL